MSITNRSIVASVFSSEPQAQQAMADLQNAGFTDQEIRYSVHKGGSGILDSLENLGLSRDEAAFYNSEFEAGRTVVTVHTSDRQQEAYEILTRDGGYDASRRMGQTANYAGATVPTDQSGYTTDADQKMRLHEEQLAVQKQQAQMGEVGIHKDVVTEERTLDVPVTHEEVYIERRPVSGNVSADDATFSEQDEEIRIPVREEQVQVTKQPVVTEEINVKKRAVTENQQVTDTVRREEARFDKSGDVNVQGSDVQYDSDQTTP